MVISRGLIRETRPYYFASVAGPRPRDKSSLEYVARCEELFYIALENFHRCQILGVVLNEDFAKLFLGLADGIAPHLEGLKLESDYEFPTHLINKLIEKLSSFKNLRRLTWSLKPPWSNLSEASSALIKGPWSQLTHIELLCHISFECCLEILSQSQQAVHIDINFISENSLCPVRNIIVLPTVKHLGLGSESDVGDVLRHLSLPALRLLQIFNRKLYPSTRDYQSFGEFLTRSKCPLEELIFTDIHYREHHIVGYLQIPQLILIPVVTFSAEELSEERIFDLTKESENSALILSRLRVHDGLVTVAASKS
ncbi:hypothetical protein BDQ12DRAFT_669301 [Crucibulum laeve]|uniref:F-box domain-containing protein n=1 Tax=Crucibulum laeve TaxID=68775 RepID=A0A5C3LN01_9AGAR|nr:hypothetical protein BDQ12DRAFT_669301 [Crucibulum laeve]